MRTNVHRVGNVPLGSWEIGQGEGTVVKRHIQPRRESDAER